MLVPNRHVDVAAVQYAALPYRIDSGEMIEVALLRTRENRRWRLPIGWPAAGAAPHEVAARRAFEDAGLLGRTRAAPLGKLTYGKRLKCGSVISCQMTVFPFHVEEQLGRWPGEKRFEVAWHEVRDAAALVLNPTLARLIRRLEPHSQRNHP